MSNETTPAEAGAADHAFEETGTDATVEVADLPEADAGEASAAAERTEADGTDAEPDGAQPAAVEVAPADEEVTPADEEVTPADEEDADPAAPRSGRRAQLEREGEVAADFLETLLDICDLDGDLDVDIDGDRAAVAIVDSDEGRVPRRLVGADAQVLEALQELTRLAVQSETGERSRLMLDVAGHRAERRSELVTLAQAAIAEVQSSGERKSLTPMTAFERKVVHDEVLAAGLVSESEGSEPRRFVVISPA